MFGITSIEHAIARVGKEIVTGAKTVAGALAKIDNPEVVKTVEAVTSVLYPNAVAVEDASFNALGKIATAAQDVVAISDKGATLNIQLTAQELADFKAIASSIKQLFPAKGITVPTPATTPAPAPAQ